MSSQRRPCKQGKRKSLEPMFSQLHPTPWGLISLPCWLGDTWRPTELMQYPEFRPGPPSLCVFTRGQSLAEGQQPCLSCSRTWPGSWGMSPVLFSSLIWFTSAFSGGVPEGVPSSPAVLFGSWKHLCQGRDRSPWSQPAGLPRG